jgi:hypothetical protein
MCCWKDKPEDRSTFEQLSKLLKGETTEYLLTTQFKSNQNDKMNVEQVCNWMQTLNLSQDYSKVIRENAIDGAALKHMTNKKDWNDLGIVAFGDVKKILAEIPKLFPSS